MTLPKDRVPYSAIVDRPPLVLPNAGRIAVWTIVNVEEWSIERAMPRAVLPPPMGKPLLPDLPNWAWHEYGMRVGFWRLLECLQKFGIRPTFAVNGSVCRSYPRIADAAQSGRRPLPSGAAPSADPRSGPRRRRSSLLCRRRC